MSIIAIDIGGSTIDMVEFDKQKQTILQQKTIESKNHKKKDLLEIVEFFGIRNKILQKKNLFLTGASALTFPDCFIIEGEKIFLQKVHEFESIAKGGKFLSEEEKGLVISLGTGTAMVSFEGDNWNHVRGTGLGGGSFMGLGRAILGANNFEELQLLVEKGNLKNIDISVGDIAGGDLGSLPAEMTAANFAKYTDNSTKEDIALGIANLVGQSIATLAVEKAKRLKLQTIIIGGKFSRLSFIVERIEQTAKIFGMNVIVPKNAGFMTTVGACV